MPLLLLAPSRGQRRPRSRRSMLVAAIGSTLHSPRVFLRSQLQGPRASGRSSLSPSGRRRIGPRRAAGRAMTASLVLRRSPAGVGGESVAFQISAISGPALAVCSSRAARVRLTRSRRLASQHSLMRRAGLVTRSDPVTDSGCTEKDRPPSAADGDATDSPPTPREDLRRDEGRSHCTAGRRPRADATPVRGGAKNGQTLVGPRL